MLVGRCFCGLSGGDLQRNGGNGGGMGDRLIRLSLFYPWSEIMEAVPAIGPLES
jgi:hypothetical protein